MKNLILLFIFSIFSGYSFAQKKVRESSRIQGLFEKVPLNYDCDSWGKKCFFELHPKQAKKDRPDWMRGGNKFYAIEIPGTNISRGYSDAYSIMKNTNVWLKKPVMDFRVDETKTIFIIYKTGIFPKQ